MQVHQSYVTDFLSEGKRLFIIPPYQRRYAWGIENLRRFFDDIQASKNSNNSHFMGTICYKISERNCFIIIDGQQRLTTFSIFLRALKEIVNLDDDIDRCLYNRGRGFDDYQNKIRLHLSPSDDEAWKRILATGRADGETRLDAAFNFFTSSIKKVNNPENLWDAVESMTFIELEVQDENPQSIFESLNSTGLALTDADRIRNFMLMGENNQDELYSSRWKPVEDAMGEELNNFLVHFLVDARRSSSISYGTSTMAINKNTLYRSWKYWANGKDKRKILDEMYEYSQYYQKFITPEWENEPMNLFHATDARIIYAHIERLLASREITAEEARKGMQAVASYIMRSRVCGTSKIKMSMAATIVRTVSGDMFEDSLWHALTDGKGSLSFPSDNEFISSLTNNDLYSSLRSSGVKYLFYALEKAGPYPRGLPDFYDTDITVEHISPQTITSHWESTNLTHRLGNLALTSENSRMSNHAFNEKRPFYANEKFYLTRKVAEHSSWKDTDIILRGQELARLALEVWPLPEKYKKKTYEMSYPLSTAKKFTHTKPASIDICGISRPIASWAEMLPATIEILREFDERPVDILLDGRTDVSAVKKTGYSLCGDVYIKTSRSANDTVRATQRIVHKFDEIAGTDYEDMVMFLIRE